MNQANQMMQKRAHSYQFGIKAFRLKLFKILNIASTQEYKEVLYRCQIVSAALSLLNSDFLGCCALCELFVFKRYKTEARDETRDRNPALCIQL